jgi:YwiC-like protein
MEVTFEFIRPPTASMPVGSVPRPAGTVFLPKEHGSWSLALEPLALGLLVAPSWAGGALAAAVLAGFFARRPLKASFDPVNTARRVTARETLVMWSALAVAGLFEAGVLAGWPALWPLLLAVPFGALFIWCDRRGTARAAVAELAGCAAFALVPAAVATVAGLRPDIALALAAVAAARSLPAILTVRSFLRTAKGEPAGAGLAVGSAFVALLALVTLVTANLLPAVAAGWGGVLLARTLWLVGPWRPAWPARRIGQMEAALGLLYVVIISNPRLFP